MDSELIDLKAQFDSAGDRDGGRAGDGDVSLISRQRYHDDDDNDEHDDDDIHEARSLTPSRSNQVISYHDDPTHSSEPLELEPQRYISSSTGTIHALIVQSTREAQNVQRPGTWRNVQVSGRAVPELRLSTWVLGVSRPDARVSISARILSLMRASLASPVFAALAAATFRKYWLPLPVPDKYPEFQGSYRGALARTSAESPRDDSHDHSSVTDESGQKRLMRPRKLMVKSGDSWHVVDGDCEYVDKPYIFISYAANQFERTYDTTGRLVLSGSAAQQLTERASKLVEENNLEAYWISFLCAPHQPEATDDVHQFCDTVRGCERVCVLLSEKTDMDRSLAMFGKRLWSLPECLLAPNHEVYVQGGGRSEVIRIINLPQLCWMRTYTDDAGVVVSGRGEEEDFRLLAEHFSGLLTLSQLELFSIALRAMRVLDFFASEKGNIAYCLMGFLRKRPKMKRTDSEEKALARLCLSSGNDRMLERMVCMLPKPEKSGSKPKGWIGHSDAFDANIWDIEPMCEIAAICEDDNDSNDDEAVIMDGCCGIPIEWSHIPRIAFRARLSPSRARVMRLVLASAYWWSIAAFASMSSVLAISLIESVLRRILFSSTSNPSNGYQSTSASLYRILYYLVISTVIPSLFFAFTAPFYIPLAYGSGSVITSHLTSHHIEEVQPFLVGIQGVLPIAEIERLAFGNVTHRLTYSKSASSLCSSFRDLSGNPGLAPVIDATKVPRGHVVFTLLDTGSLTVTIFSAPRPPTVALLCGQEGDMLRAVLCSYNVSQNALRKETVLRMETAMLDHASKCGWQKLSL